MTDRAFLVGINDYASISDLRGCENDVHNMARLLTEGFGFASQNVRKCLSREATKPNVMEGFDWLLDGAQRGDRLVLHIAGHGSYVESVDDDEEIDELVCLYDMNIDDPDTYLLDDDLGRFTRRVPDGVRLTVVLDTCHSGTGTRNAGLGRRSAQSQLLVIEDTARRMHGVAKKEAEGRLTRGDTATFEALEQDPREVVLARVYERSQRLQKRKLSSRITRFGAGMMADTRSGALNHQLLAAAAATQTAADAYIDGAFCGAFTYFLCQSARALGAASTTGEVMTLTTNDIRGDGFSQTPQNEGPYGNDPLFGQSAPIVTPKTSTPPGNVDRPVMPGSTSREELLSQLLRVAEKFIDLADHLVTAEPARTATISEVAGRGNEFVVYVHGISKYSTGYSLPWYEAMKSHLARTITRREVLWSPVVNPRGSRAANRSLTSEEREFVETMQMIVDERRKQQLATASAATRAAAQAQSRSDRGGGMSFDDFARYMFNRSEREEILGLFDGLVRPLLEANATVHLICHSWGTVVTWEGLRRLDALSLSGRVANLFLVGSALSAGPVQTNLLGRITDGRRPQVVDRVINLDARGDLVGGFIGDVFAVDQEFLDLAPTGCSTFPFIGLRCAHSSYFRPDNLAVMRDIFAQFINT